MEEPLLRKMQMGFLRVQEKEEAKAYYADIKKKTNAFGRNPDELSILPGIIPVIGDSQEEADRKHQEVANLVTIDKALDDLGRPFDHHDFSQYPFDEPFPELGEFGSNSLRGTSEKIKQIAKEQNLTLRQVALNVATPKGQFVGTPKE